jgi:alpha-glucosidase
VNHYQRITELAAKYNIMLNVHEPVKDTGERRTWPNIMTREGARGGEWNAWSEGNPPEHTLILPFTRLLAGPMDYTVGIVDVDFSNFAGKRFDWHGKPQTANYRVHTTVAKQLANMVILYSPLQMVADLVENYRGHAALNFIRHFKADYTQQWIPHASIGEYITVVRETHNEWFIGSSTNSEERELTLTLDFLPSGKTFKIDMFKDGEDAHWQTNPESLTVSTLAVNSQSTIRIKMASGGGFAARIYE